VSDELLSRVLGGLGELNSLSLDAIEGRPATFAAIRENAAAIEKLHVNTRQLTDESLARLEGLPLRSLRIDGRYDKTDSGEVRVSRFAGLEVLEMWFQPTRAEWQDARKLTRLKELSLGSEHLSDKDAARVRDFPELRDLTIWVKQAGRKTVDALLELPDLRWLNLHGDDIKDKDFLRLAAHPSIEWIGFRGLVSKNAFEQAVSEHPKKRFLRYAR
jgi:hypothetical protein